MSKSVKIYDPIRKKQVAKTPEESIRQCVLLQMLGPLSFPKGLVSVEASLGQGRRADIVSYYRAQETLLPLLVIECKATLLEEEAYFQAAGYQWMLDAPFLCVAHAGGMRTFWKEGGALQSVSFLPPYPQLIRRISQ